MDYRFHFHLFCVLRTYGVFGYLNVLILSSSVNSLETQDRIHLQKYAYINKSSSNSASLITQMEVQNAIKELQLSGIPEKGRPRRQVTTQIPDLCQDASINTAVTTEDRRTYLFKGDFYWELTGKDETRIADGYPRKISEDWGGLPGNLDAAITWTNGNTFFFKENQYWRFKNKKMDSGYPKEISVGFEGIPNSVDAAFVWGGNGKIYFFKGSEYWRYIDSTEPPVPTNYPLAISTWEGVPNNIDAALEWPNGQTYFFKGKSYYRFDDGSFKVANDDPSGPYPRSTSVWWLGCREKSTSNENLTTTPLKEDDSHFVGDGGYIHNIDEEDSVTTSTETFMENDHVGSSETFDVDEYKNEDDGSTIPSLQNEDSNSAASSSASLLLSLLLVAILKTLNC